MNTRNDILQLIEDEDVEFIRLQFTDIWGNLKNIAVTPGEIIRAIDNKFPIDSSALYDGMKKSDNELFLVPDLDSFVILPWRPQQGKVGKMTCDVVDADGNAVKISPRAILKRVTGEATALGYDFKINPECEFFLFNTDENGMPTVNSPEKAGYLDVGPVDFGENCRRDMVLNLEDMGFEIESSYHEKAPAQHEIDFGAEEPLKCADDIMTFRFAVRSIAKRFGLYATFLPKPKTSAAGSGLCLNFTIYKDGKNIFSDGNNGKYFLSGILMHATGMCAVTNPIVNSYKRIIGNFTGGESLAVIREAFGETKIKVKFPDSASNPYLVIALLIKAGLDGIKNKTLVKDKHVNLPVNLDNALSVAENDAVVRDTLGEEFLTDYINSKKIEWTEYMTEVSDWEIEKYLIKM